MQITQKLNKRLKKVNSVLCVGLDTDFAKIPTKFKKMNNPQFEFNKWIIDQTHPYVCAYKPNLAFYEARGEAGWHDLALTMDYLHQHHPQIVTIADAKRADIGSTNNGYVQAIFDNLGFDAVTLNPYLGREALQPFLERTDKASIILVKTSNPGAGELQDLLVKTQTGDLPLWQYTAKQVVQTWSNNKNCWLVAGATYLDQIRELRQMFPQTVFLIPGVGQQGGDLSAVLQLGLTKQRAGIVVNISRSIIFAQDPKAESQKVQFVMNQQLNSTLNRSN